MLHAYLNKMKGKVACPPLISFSRIVLSGLGAFVGIYMVAILGRYSPLAMFDHLFLVGSFGASAVLLYGSPHVEYAQPRNLIGGHIISAAVGVAIYQNLSLDVALLSALAVSVAIMAMHLSRTLHPPGGASALIAVIGSAQIHELGYAFVLTVGIGALVLLLVALVLNNLSSDPKRHYPQFW